MKTHFTRLLKNCSLVAALLVTGWTNAATYTAVTSGAWSSATTWGGVAPGTSIGTFDNVVINAGVTVTLDNDVEFSGLLTSLQVNGTLESSDYLLDINNGVLSGNGTLNLENLRFGTGGTMTFTGTSSIDKLWSSSIAFDLVGHLDVNDSLFLDGGTFNLASGGALAFMSGSVVRIDDGALTISSGVLTNTNNYSVVYVGSDKNAGLELAGNGLTDVWVDLDDNNQSLSIVGNMTIHGTLHHNHGTIDLNGGSLTLMGDYHAMGGAEFMGSASSDLTIMHGSSLSNSLMFDGAGDELHNLTINISGSNGNVNLGSSLSIAGSLNLEDGNFTVTSGTLTMETGSEIVIEDGHLMNTGGFFDGNNAYSVTYQSSGSLSSGLELTGSGLSDLHIDMEHDADSVEIMNTITVYGDLDLENGGMAMNGYDLTLAGSLSTSTGGWFSGDDESDLTFNTNTLLGDTVWFHATNNHFGTITINSSDASDLMVGNNLHVENINMSSGGMHIWDNEIWVNSTGTISGADEDRYITIDGNGSLVMNVQVSAPYVMYPVGTDHGYSPVGLQQNSGTAGYFKVSAMNGVWSNGTSGTNWAINQNMVDRTWDIHSVNGGSLNLNLRTLWSSDFEANDFDRTNAYIMHYTSGSWDSQSQTGSAAVAVGTMFQLERQNITSLSPFAVRDAGVMEGDENTVVAAEMYPNPVHDQLNTVITLDEATTAEVVDATGNVLHTENINGTGTVSHKMDFSTYPNGVYFVKYTNSKGTSAYRIVKSL